LFLSVFNSFTFDFILRQSLGGANLNKYILKQLPMPTPTEFSKKTVDANGVREDLDDFLINRTRRLVWTSHSLDGLGNQGGMEGPVSWNDDKRAEWKAEINAAIAHIYGVSRPDFKFILEEFDVLKQKEVAEFGRYKTKVKTLEAFDEVSIDE